LSAYVLLVLMVTAPSVAVAQASCAGVTRQYGPWKSIAVVDGVEFFAAPSVPRCADDLISVRIRLANHNPRRVLVRYSLAFSSSAGANHLVSNLSNVLNANWKAESPWMGEYQPFAGKTSILETTFFPVSSIIVTAKVCPFDEARSTDAYTNPCDPTPSPSAPGPGPRGDAVRPPSRGSEADRDTAGIPASAASVIPSIEKGDTAELRSLLAAGASPDAKEMSYGMPALMLAARKGRPDMIALLLAARANVNARANDGYTALMSAVNSGVPRSVELLLQAKADPNLRTSTGATALSILLYTNPAPGHPILRLLRQHGAR
jgi:hypothetical protein